MNKQVKVHGPCGGKLQQIIHLISKERRTYPSLDGE